jgi:hypothetical protein
MTVSGCTMTSADRQFGQKWESHTQKTRSRGRRNLATPAAESPASDLAWLEKSVILI